MPATTDPQLIAACLKGDQRAWNDLVDRYTQLVYSVPRKHGLSDADAAEVFQGVFIILFRKLHTLKDDLLLARWLLTTAHRETWRIGKKSNQYKHLDETVSNVAFPRDDDVLRWERQQAVREALRELGSPCEELLTALFLAADRPNYQAIAESLDIKPGSIGPTRARCFKKLERILTRMSLSPETASAESFQRE